MNNGTWSLQIRAIKVLVNALHGFADLPDFLRSVAKTDKAVAEYLEQFAAPYEAPKITGVEARRLILEQANAAAKEDALRGVPRTVVGRSLRSLRNALDRKALLAVALKEGLSADAGRGLLDTRRPSWKSAARMKWTTSPDESAALSPLGVAIGFALRRQNSLAGLPGRTSWDDKTVLTWADLLGALS